jgi:hypothetical protein
MKKSLLIAACGLAAIACGASAQGVSTGVAGSLSSGGTVSNYGAGASPTFGAGARMNAPDLRVQGSVQPNVTASTPDAKEEARRGVDKVENKRDATEKKLDNRRENTEEKIDRKVDKATQ